MESSHFKQVWLLNPTWNTHVQSSREQLRGYENKNVLAWGPMCHTYVDSNNNNNNNRGRATYFPAECSYASFKGDSCDKKSKGQMQNNKISTPILSAQKMCDNHHWSTAPSVSSSWCFPHLKILWTPVSWNKKKDEVRTDLIPELLLDAKISLLHYGQ